MVMGVIRTYKCSFQLDCIPSGYQGFSEGRWCTHVKKKVRLNTNFVPTAEKGWWMPQKRQGSYSMLQYECFHIGAFFLQEMFCLKRKTASGL
jgi:hypothetical protein